MAGVMHRLWSALILPGALSLAFAAPVMAQDAPAPAPTPAEAAAQEAAPKDAASISQEVSDDRGFLTRFLERNLSDAGREVRINGFRGALSSRATFDEITITDKDGAWITLHNGAIQWNRSALLARRVEIAELSAETIDLPRRPDPGEKATPKAEARPFSLPQLPVSVEIQKISAQRVNLGQPVIGEAAAVAIDGSMSLKGGEGEAKLAINRVDGKRGVFAVDAGYSNSTTNLRADVTLDEEANGIFANLVRLEGRPAVKATIKGEGPINDFDAAINLATDGQPRVTGNVALKAEAGPDGAPGRGFRVRLGGDVAALVPEGQRDFFGSESQLLAQGWRGDNGRLTVPVLLLDTDALNVSGSFATNEQGAPVNAVLMLTLGADAGAKAVPVRLPTRGEPTTVRGGRLQLSYDAAQSSGWTLKGHVDDFAQSAIRIGAMDLDGAGTVRLDGGALKQVAGKLTFDTTGIAPSDPGLAAAVGEVLKGVTSFDWTPDNAASLNGLNVTGADYGLKGDLRVDGLSSGITVSGDLDARYDDLRRLSTLAGRPMQGRAEGHVSGLYTVLSRAFDAEANLTGTDLRLGQEQLDRLLAGNATITASARRDETGIDLRELTVNGERLTADAKGTISSAASDLTATVRLANLAQVDPRFGGTLDAQASLTGPAGGRLARVDGKAVDLTTGIAALDGALKGQTDLALNAQEQGGGFILNQLRLANPQLTLTGQGNLTPGQMDAGLSFAMPDVGKLGPGWAGSLTAEGRVTEADGARKLTLTGTGQDLRLGNDKAGGALSGETTFALDATQRADGSQVQIDRFDVNNAQLNATVAGPIGKDSTDLRGRVEAKSLTALRPDWAGALRAEGSFTGDGQGNRVLDVTGTGDNIAIGRPEVDGLLRGASRFTLRGTERDGTFTIAEANAASDQLNASATGQVGKAGTDVKGTAAISDLAALGRGWKGAVQAEGSVRDDGTGGQRFDLTGTGQNLSLGRSDVDGALTGTTNFILRGARKGQDITLDEARIVNDQAKIDASGTVGPSGTDVKGTAAIASLEALGLGWKGSVDLAGSYADDGKGGRRIDVTGTGEGLAMGQAQADAALTGTTRLVLKAVQGADGFVIEQADLTNDQAVVTAAGKVGRTGTDLSGKAQVRSLAPFGPGWGGSLDLTGSFRDDGTGGRRLQVAGTGHDLKLGQPQVNGALRGETVLTLTGVERDGVFTIETADVKNPQATATASGSIGRGATDARAHVEMPSLAPLGAGYRGAVVADATLKQQGNGPRAFTLTGTGRDLSLGQSQVDAALQGQTRFDVAGSESGGVVTLDRAEIDNPRLKADVTGRVGGGLTDLSGNVRADSLAFLGRGLRGGLTATGAVRQQGGTLTVTAKGEGRGLGLGNPKADALLGGTTSFDLAATRRGQELTVERLSARNPQLTLTADGALSSGIRLDARLADLALLAPGFSGPATANGTVSRNGQRLGLDLALTGPRTNGTVKGTAAQDFSDADLRIAGTSDAAIANPFLRVRSIEGPVNFDLRLNGKPSLQALTGRISLPAARLSDPKLGVRLEALRLDADLGGGGVTVNGGGNLADGGTLAVDGRIGLEGDRPVNLTIRLDRAAMRDPNLYQTTASGTLTVSGNLAAGPLIAGRLALGPTEIRIPSTGLGGAKDIPKIKHLGDRPPVRATRAKAGLTPYPGPESREAGLAGPPATPPTVVAKLDVTIDAPNQVFVRGRGVDAEFGGTIRLTGTARQIVPIGFLQLIRGRVDLLGKRFDLAEGLVELQGSLVPAIRLVAENEQDGITTRISIEGDATDPKISFTSDPDMPQEEVLSHLLFGRGLDNISALQAAQLANAVAVLAGRGGEGIISQLRNQVGLDDLDLATDDEGNVTVRAGKYITDKVYTDVAVGGDGKTKLNVNLDITKELTARGSINNEGDSSIGLFFEKDY